MKSVYAIAIDYYVGGGHGEGYSTHQAIPVYEALLFTSLTKALGHLAKVRTNYGFGSAEVVEIEVVS